MANDLNNAIIKTICYADIFEYPLKISESKKYLISSIPYSLKQIKNSIDTINNLKSDGKYVFLNNRNDLVIERKSRQKESQLKFIKAKKIAGIVRYIPTIELIGVSGSLAMNNCKKNDDIDFFIITKPYTLWLTRFIVTIVLLLLSQKRSAKVANAKNKICTNMFLTTNTLTLQKKNLFTAHEVVQCKVLINKNNTYDKFLYANKWVLKYLPHGFKMQESESNVLSPKFHFLKFIDKLLYIMQIFYMSKRRTIEEVTDETALFHPQDKTSYVLQEFKKRYKKFQLKTHVKNNRIITNSSYFSAL